MELVYLQYKDRCVLLLHLGDRADKICGLLADQLSESDRELIRNHKDFLYTLPLEQKFQWLQNNCPTAVKNQYREIYTSNINIINRYKIN